MKNVSHSLSTSNGYPQPIGASSQKDGINFAIYSNQAASVTLCLFESQSTAPIHEIEVFNKTGDIWHILVVEIPHSLFYAYRIEGQKLSNSKKTYLLDPHTKGVVSSVILN